MYREREQGLSISAGWPSQAGIQPQHSGSSCTRRSTQTSNSLSPILRARACTCSACGRRMQRTRTCARGRSLVGVGAEPPANQRTGRDLHSDPLCTLWIRRLLPVLVVVGELPVATPRWGRWGQTLGGAARTASNRTAAQRVLHAASSAPHGVAPQPLLKLFDDGRHAIIVRRRRRRTLALSSRWWRRRWKRGRRWRWWWRRRWGCRFGGRWKGWLWKLGRRRRGW